MLALALIIACTTLIEWLFDDRSKNNFSIKPHVLFAFALLAVSYWYYRIKNTQIAPLALVVLAIAVVAHAFMIHFFIDARMFLGGLFFGGIGSIVIFAIAIMLLKSAYNRGSVTDEPN